MFLPTNLLNCIERFFIDTITEEPISCVSPYRSLNCCQHGKMFLTGVHLGSLICQNVFQPPVGKSTVSLNFHLPSLKIRIKMKTKLIIGNANEFVTIKRKYNYLTRIIYLEPKLTEHHYGKRTTRSYNCYINFYINCYINYCYHYNPSRPDPGGREKMNLNFYFHTSLLCLKRFYEGL